VSRIDDALAKIDAGTASADALEGDLLDFKREGRSRSDTALDMADAAVCFANAGGGTIVLGVSDTATGPEAFLGTALDRMWLRRRIYEVTSPPLDVVIRERYHRGSRLLEIEVQEGLDVHSSRQKMPSRRFLDTCVAMTPAEVSRLHEDRRGGDWSASNSFRSIADVGRDAELVLRGLVARTSATAIAALADGGLRDLLAALGLVTGTETLNRAGELLLCTPVEPREVLVYQHRASAGGEADAGRRWTGPLLLGYTELIATLEARIGTTPVNLPSGQQMQIQDYPLTALREAITNAIMHGDHRERRPVYVEHSPELLQVLSPGPLVAGISPENILTHPPKPRFPALAEAMRSLGLAEKWGQGVDRMYREMIRSGRDAPTVEVRSGAEPETIVHFIGGPPNTRITKFVSSLPAAEQDDTDVLLLVSYLTNNRTVTAPKFARVIQRDEVSAQSLLSRVSNSETGFVEPTAGTLNRRSPTYRLRGAAVASLGPALAYQTRPQGERVRKVVDHVLEYESVNNATVQRLFDVDVHAASAILQDLVAKKLLVRTSEQTRGTAVRYGPGSSFPVKGR
jgi:ATP-dependent DNA helicase RecG